MRCISNHKWGADKKTLTTIYKTLILPIIDYASIAYDNASNTHKKNLEQTQNKALTYICGAFRGTNVAFLQNECGILPLQLRRLEAQIKYTLRAETVHQHITREIFTDHWTLHYGKHNKNQTPIANKIKHFIKKMKQDMQVKKYSELPPWKHKAINTNKTLSQEINKSETPPEISKTKAEQLIDMYRNTTHIYTDGSKTDNNKTGYAVYIPKYDVKISIRTSNNISVYTTEMLAIKHSLKWILTNPQKTNTTPITILTDSKSSIEALEAPITKKTTNLINQIKDLITQIENRIEIVWIPAHVGIKGNEKADLLAKQATDKQNIDIKTEITAEESIPLIHKYINQKWQNIYNRNKTKSHYKILEPKVTRNIKYTNKKRKNETLITRLRLGKCKLNKYLLDYKIHQSGLCEKCQVPEDIEHLLINCTKHKLASILKLKCKEYNSENNIKNILSKDIFIKEIINNLEIDI